MRGKRIIGILLCSIPTTLLFSIDDASFWNLGFSTDSRYVSFGQYWIDSAELRANAELNVIDTERNNFVQNGRVDLRSEKPISVGYDGRNAVLTLLRENNELLKNYGIEHTNQGRIIYLSLADAAQSDTIEFQDFQSNIHYSVQLISSKNNTGAAFHLKGTIRDPRKGSRDFSVGLANYYRRNVQKYTIAQIIISPGNNNLVFVIEQLVEQAHNTSTTRYMVETLSLD